MQIRTATVQIEADDVQPFGLWNGLYVRFQDDGSAVVVTPQEVMDAFIQAGARIPDSFVEVREAIQVKLNQLQAVL